MDAEEFDAFYTGSVQREAIALHHLCDLSVHQVAEAVGAPVGTVKARLSRGRASLAILLETEPTHA